MRLSLMMGVCIFLTRMRLHTIALTFDDGRVHIPGENDEDQLRADDANAGERNWD